MLATTSSLLPGILYYLLRDGGIGKCGASGPTMKFS